MSSLIIPGLLDALGAIGSGIFQRDKGTQLSELEGKQNNIIDLIMQAVQGQGPLASLVQGDDNAFQQSVVNPLMQKFNTQTAPNIQQSFISNRLQGGTGLNDALARAGADVQGDINSQFLNFQNQGQNNLLNLLQASLGAKPNIANEGQSVAEGGVGGLLEFLSKFDKSDLLIDNKEDFTR